MPMIQILSATTVAVAAALSACAAPAAQFTQTVWPAEAPGEEPRAPGAAPRIEEANGRVTKVVDPTLTLFRPDESVANGCAVVVCPGGGYHILAVEKEGNAVARWLNSLGVTAAVLRYRVPRRDPERPHAAPLQDVQRAIRLVRANAEPWGVDAKRVGVLGFSAGGNLTVMAGTRFGDQTYSPVDAADALNCRPDFLVPIYPAYLGNERAPDADLAPTIRVTERTPPTFLAVTSDDRNRGTLSAKLFVALREAGVPAELHVFVKGGHGYGLGRPGEPVAGWPALCAKWMRTEGLLTSADGEGWTALFDGATFDGWQQRGGRAEFRIEDGEIVGTTQEGVTSSYLLTEQTYKDFVLEFETKFANDLNSGVQLRTRSRPDYRNGAVFGPQVELDAEPGKTGALHGQGLGGWLVEPDLDAPATAAFRRGEWNRIRVEAQGPRIRVWVNGAAGADFLDEAGEHDVPGWIGLQVHSVVGDRWPAGREVRWRNLRLRELKAEPRK